MLKRKPSVILLGITMKRKFSVTHILLRSTHYMVNDKHKVCFTVSEVKLCGIFLVNKITQRWIGWNYPTQLFSNNQ